MSEKMTAEEWIKKMNELGYYMTQPSILYEPKGWKMVVQFCAIVVSLGIVFGSTFFAVQFFDMRACMQHSEANHD